MIDPRHAAALYSLETCIDQYIADRHARVDHFVGDHFSVHETFALQKASLAGDFLCYPLNALWAIPQMFLKKAVEVPGKLGWRMGTDLSGRIPSGLKTRYQREMEWLITTELLEWPCVQRDRRSSRNALEDVIAQHPDAGRLLAGRGVSAGSLADFTNIASIVEGHSSSRTFVSDSAATLLTLGAGWFFFGDHSLGLSGMGDRVARKVARDKAASTFVLGPSLGSTFYSFFPPKPTTSQIVGATVAIGCAITAISLLVGLLSDPCRKWLGLQRLHLHALIDEVEDVLYRQLRKQLKPALLKHVA